ncbi:MAG: glycosyltransferase family 1 protein [Bryobacteraceae bacterium]|jgi:glycosyltransferase involved in cell wall biosynthesis
MRIMLDATSLLLRGAGVKTYMYYWIRSLQRSATQDLIRLFPFFGGLTDLDHESSSIGRWRTTLGALVVHFSNIKWNPVVEVVGCAADVFHASQHLRNPPHLATRLTATIYDMTCWLMPEVHVPANVAATRRYGERVLRRATACIAISEQSKKDAVEILKLPADRIDVIYPGVAEEFFTVEQAEAQAVAKRHRLDKPYLLYVGTIEPRKNVDRLLDAYRSIYEPVRKAHELVIVGPLGWCSEATRDRLRAPEPGIRYLGYVSEDDLPGLTAGATAFVFPSLYEGFGLPLVQAMACGVPAITSRGSSLGEVAGEDAILVDPRNTDAIAAAMQRLALSPSLREDLGQRGRLRAASFRWERNAQQSLAFFHKLASC